MCLNTFEYNYFFSPASIIEVKSKCDTRISQLWLKKKYIYKLNLHLVSSVSFLLSTAAAVVLGLSSFFVISFYEIQLRIL